jgi:pyridoxamine-phosphate oxidase
MNLNAIRDEYKQTLLDTNDLDLNPEQQLIQWFNEALKAEVLYPNAATLVSIDNNKPTARIILIKDILEGITFFTNYDSPKAAQMLKNNHICLNIFWKELDRQVRIEGTVTKVSPEISQAYFYSRPRESQISAIVSPQGKIIPSRESLEQKASELREKYQNQELPMPSNWGGYLLTPNYYEFWQGRPNRLHDRFMYEKQNTNDWKIARLAP